MVPASPPRLRFALVSLLLVAAAAAGCLDSDDADSDGGRLGGSDDGASPWDFEQILIGPGGDAETSVLVGKDGLVLACSHGGFEMPSPSWVSQDGGDTWRRLDPQPNPIVSGDCDWAVLEDGTWGIVYDTIASATVATSTDEGQSWFINYGSALPVGGVDRPWLASQGNTMYMAYANVMAVEPAINMFAVSRDGGRTWVEHSLAHSASVEESDRPNTVIGHPVIDGQTIRIPLASANLNQGGPTTLSFAVSHDEGATWTEETVAGPYDTSFHLPVATLAPDGTLYTTLVERDGADAMLIAVLVSHDDGQTWDRIDVASGVTFPSVSGPWIDARPDGSATLAWLQEDAEGETRTIWAARIDGEGIVRSPRPLIEPVEDSSIFEFIMLDHDEAGRAFIVYPMDTGDCSVLGLTDGRNAQCVWLLREHA